MPKQKVIPVEPRILILRKQRVMLDSHLAELYGVMTKELNKAVTRNLPRFPKDFMFQVTAEEVTILRFQFGTSSLPGWGGRRTRPFVFTQEGVAMLSSVLRSPRAIEVNVAIMRAFSRLRQMALSVDELVHRVEELERGLGRHNDDFAKVFAALRQLIAPPDPQNREMGFHVREDAAPYRAKPRRKRVAAE